MKKQNGITLVALVITIIVLLILAGASISAALGDNGILRKAEDAVATSNAAAVKEEIDLWVLEYKMGKYSSSNDGETLEEFLTGLESQGKITADQKDALLKGQTIEISGQEISIKGIPVAAGTPLGDLTNASGTAIGTKVADGADGEVPVPTGFYFVGGTVSGGAVISDNPSDENKYKGKANVGTDLVGNQFVWVPVDGTTLEYKQDKQYNDGTTDSKQYYYTQYTDWTDNGGNATSVATYGGFYVGRYEAGIPETASFYPDADNSYAYSNATTKNIGTMAPVIKAKVPSWNYISQDNAELISKAMYAGSSSVTSNLIDSYAWDTVTTWFGQAGKNLVDSTSYGNYYTSNFSVADTLFGAHSYNAGWTVATAYSQGTATTPNGTGTSRVELPTGATEVTKVKNIYDFAGNMWEWTTEEGAHDVTTAGATKFAVLRGGSFGNNGGDHPVVYRNGNSTTSSTDFSVGFRVALYIK